MLSPITALRNTLNPVTPVISLEPVWITVGDIVEYNGQVGEVLAITDNPYWTPEPDPRDFLYVALVEGTEHFPAEESYLILFREEWQS